MSQKVCCALSCVDRGIATRAPERHKDLAELGLKAMTGGAIASGLTACVAGLMLT
jgi:CNT family concentrative nucleoside transporter